MRRETMIIVYDERNFEIITIFFSEYQFLRFINNRFNKAKTIYGCPKEYIRFYYVCEDEVLDIRKGIRIIDSDIDLVR